MKNIDFSRVWQDLRPSKEKLTKSLDVLTEEPFAVFWKLFWSEEG